ncbi:MAG: CRISPR system precrRNA processing endoribonuclease RAMP protein Cas6 [Calothrix sp. C42_A2020_038]|nr:CRISPR system precrRNA processing endoribonuclease RAMP protein Cas6 [Calothrix sp. C42_A2020_038]
MTYITDTSTETNLAGLSVVLRSTQAVCEATPLICWLPNELSPAWIPQRYIDGVTKIMPVLPQPAFYENLMQSILQQIGSNNLVEWRQKTYELTGVEVNNNSLHSIQVAINPVIPLPPTIARAVHALCFHWFAKADANLAQTLHEQDNLPITSGIEYCSPKKILLKINLLQKELLAPLLWGMSSDLGNEINITGVPCRLNTWVDVVQASSYEKLMQIPAQKFVQLEFLTPTSFKQGKYIQAFPLLELVFNGLLKRWNKFAPENLHFPPVEWNGFVSAYELKTYAMKMEGGGEIGAEGRVKYHFADAEQAKIATILAHFACFAGVGRKTTMGMGQIVII